MEDIGDCVIVQEHCGWPAQRGEIIFPGGDEIYTKTVELQRFPRPPRNAQAGEDTSATTVPRKNRHARPKTLMTFIVEISN